MHLNGAVFLLPAQDDTRWNKRAAFLLQMSVLAAMRDDTPLPCVHCQSPASTAVAEGTAVLAGTVLLRSGGVAGPTSTPSRNVPVVCVDVAVEVAEEVGVVGTSKLASFRWSLSRAAFKASALSLQFDPDHLRTDAWTRKPSWLHWIGWTPLGAPVCRS